MANGKRRDIARDKRPAAAEGDSLVDAENRSRDSERVISAMPVVIRYKACLATVSQTVEEGQTYFNQTPWGWVKKPDGSFTEKLADLNANEVRNEFQHAKTEQQVLDFLRRTGMFYPLDNCISWAEFRKWQRLIDIVQDREGLMKVQEGRHLGLPQEDYDESGEYVEVLKLLAGYPSNSFSEPRPTMLDHETARKAGLARMDLLDDPTIRFAIHKGERVWEQQRRALIKWFIEPPISIKWIPAKDTAELREKFMRAGTLVEFIAPQQELLPVLVISPATSLQAVAAAMYAERVAGVRFVICKKCRRRFELKGRKDQEYCGERCAEAAKKARQRSNRAQRQHPPRRPA